MAAKIDVPTVEAEAEAAWRRHAFEAVANIVFRDYGQEIYTFILANRRGHTWSADEVFSTFSEDLWRSLPQFEWRCSLRAWCYRLARSASVRFGRSPHNRAARRAPISVGALAEEIAAQVRTETGVHLQTEVKDMVRELREKLKPQDRDLLILRVDRDLPWRDVAIALAPMDALLDEASLTRLEMATRQRFTEVKKRLRKLAEDAGLL
ncbi:MAG TPA: sigma-70 family RNA polymerase sigma factor [Polyangia bacterium]|nr:sigma-70 family RNA polymerase sigma factor [Polyangia bacterium]